MNAGQWRVTPQAKQTSENISRDILFKKNCLNTPHFYKEDTKNCSLSSKIWKRRESKEHTTRKY